MYPLSNFPGCSLPRSAFRFQRVSTQSIVIDFILGREVCAELFMPSTWPMAISQLERPSVFQAKEKDDALKDTVRAETILWRSALA